MSYLTLKIRLEGSKYHKLRKIIIMPKNTFFKSKFKKKIGLWDTRKNKIFKKYFTFNIYYLLSGYKNGLLPSKKVFIMLYYFFKKKSNLEFKCYFSKPTMNLF